MVRTALRWAMLGCWLGPGLALAQPSPTDSTPARNSGIKPRFELYIPSWTTLRSEIGRSHFGEFNKYIMSLLVEAGESTTKGVDVDAVMELAKVAADWPDTAIEIGTYAADTQDRPRWCILLNWPLEALKGRIETVLTSEASTSLLTDVSLNSLFNGSYEIRLPEAVLAYLVADGAERSYITSHVDLKLPENRFRPAAEAPDPKPPAIACRLNLTQTEQDSGATFFSTLRAIAGVDYAGYVDDKGDWRESVNVHWPPAVGMGAKTVVDKVKQTFFVPGEAFGSVAFASMMAPGMLEGLAGFGPQFSVNAVGQMELVTPVDAAPVSAVVDSEVCVTLLPGDGLFPVPDVVFQVRMKKPETFLEKVRSFIQKSNQAAKQEDQQSPWRELKVKDRPVFSNNGPDYGASLYMPFTNRPVFFLTKETIGDKDRDFLVVGLTPSSPEHFAERWMNLPRNADQRRSFPETKRSNGELWIHWKQLYRWVVPHLNILLNGAGRDTLLPDVEQMSERLSDGLITLKTKYTGLDIEHRGPIPSGVLVVPVLFANAMSPDDGSESDLARERLASRQLRVLYHHSKLFRKDLGRWPAEVAELDGYIDFAGHPQLLHVKQSAGKGWENWMESFLGGGEDEEDEADESDEEIEDDEADVIDDSIYVIEWGQDRWTLGFAKDTFEHLENLYVDQDGVIHRVEKSKL